MKPEIHPEYHPCVFVDVGSDFELITRSTLTSEDKREIDGVEHNIIKVEITSASHPFYTGKQRLIDTAGRIDKFRKKYGG